MLKQTLFRMVGVICLVLTTSAQAQTVKIANVQYGNHTAQAYDIYKPQNASNAPVMVMIHGGAWKIGDKAGKNTVGAKMKYWTNKGYVFVSTNYRMLPEADPYVQATDVARALKSIQDTIHKHGGDANRMVVVGHSAGAHLASLVLNSKPIKMTFGLAPWDATVLLDSGAYDVERVMHKRPTRLFKQVFGDDPTFWRKVSPVAAISHTTSPTLIVCGSKGKLKCLAAKRYAKQTAKYGTSATVFPISKSHKEINADMGASGAYTQTIDSFILQQLN